VGVADLLAQGAFAIMAVSDLINLSALLEDAKCFAMSSPNVCPASPPLGAQAGAAGVRLGRKLGLTTSRNTLLHLVRQRVPVLCKDQLSIGLQSWWTCRPSTSKA